MLFRSWGDPLERETERVRLDVLQGKVSAEAARADYGVVIDAKTFIVDEDATAKLRERMRAARTGALPMIDRGPGYEKMRSRRA